MNGITHSLSSSPSSLPQTFLCLSSFNHCKLFRQFLFESQQSFLEILNLFFCLLCCLLIFVELGISLFIGIVIHQSQWFKTQGSDSPSPIEAVQTGLRLDWPGLPPLGITALAVGPATRIMRIYLCYVYCKNYVNIPF